MKWENSSNFSSLWCASDLIVIISHNTSRPCDSFDWLIDFNILIHVCTCAFSGLRFTIAFETYRRLCLVKNNSLNVWYLINYRDMLHAFCASQKFETFTKTTWFFIIISLTIVLMLIVCSGFSRSSYVNFSRSR